MRNMICSACVMIMMSFTMTETMATDAFFQSIYGSAQALVESLPKHKTDTQAALQQLQQEHEANSEAAIEKLQQLRQEQVLCLKSATTVRDTSKKADALVASEMGELLMNLNDQALRAHALLLMLQQAPVDVKRIIRSLELLLQEQEKNDAPLPLLSIYLKHIRCQMASAAVAAPVVPASAPVAVPSPAHLETVSAAVKTAIWAIPDIATAKNVLRMICDIAKGGNGWAIQGFDQAQLKQLKEVGLITWPIKYVQIVLCRTVQTAIEAIPDSATAKNVYQMICNIAEGGNGWEIKGFDRKLLEYFKSNNMIEPLVGTARSRATRTERAAIEAISDITTAKRVYDMIYDIAEGGNGWEIQGFDLAQLKQFKEIGLIKPLVDAACSHFKKLRHDDFWMNK